MKKYYIELLLILLTYGASAQIITIPDPNFKAKLLQADNTNYIGQTTNYYTSTKIDTNNNGEIEVSEALSIRGLDISNSNISSLAGIESFTNLRRLFCNNNSLTSLDVNSLNLLRVLNCSNNSLTVLSCGNLNNTMEFFNCSYNNLTSLILPNFYEFIDQGEQSIYANCSHNQLSSITITPIEQLSLLDLSFNNLTSLSFDHLEMYGLLALSNNPLTTIDLTNVYLARQSPDDSLYFTLENTNLTELYIPFDIKGGSFSNNPNLVHLNIKNGYANYDYHYELDEYGEETGNIIYTGIQLNNDPNLALICCDESELDYYHGALPTTVQVTEYCNFTPGGNYNAIAGNVIYNCPNGTPINTNVKIKINNIYEASFADGNGSFAAYTSYGTQNVIPEFVEPNYFTVYPPNYAFDFTSLGNSVTANFCVSPNGVHPDLEISILPLTIARPGFDALYKLIIKNNGTETQSGTVALNFEDATLDFVSATPTISNQNSGLLSWNFSNLAPFQDKEISFTLNLNSPVETPAVNIGDILHFTVAINTSQTDETPNDNVAQFNQTVVGSFDPNDKLVLEGSQVSISRVGDYLNYLIRFQNTGTAAAENVVVKDFLNNFDISSLKIIGASHPYKCSLTDGVRLEAIFENINLPPSSVNEPESHGYFAFKIKPRTTTIEGDVIDNKAYIYFDYNYPIETNTVTTTFTALGVEAIRNNLFTLSPNPTSTILNITLSGNQTITKTTVRNVLGQNVLVFGDQNTIDVSSLNKGTYFVTIETDSGKATQRIIKQ